MGEITNEESSNSSTVEIYVKVETSEAHIFRKVHPTADLKRVLDILKQLQNEIDAYQKYVEDSENDLKDCSFDEKLEELNIKSQQIVRKGFLDEKTTDVDGRKITYKQSLCDFAKEDDRYNFFDTLNDYFRELLGDKLHNFGLSCKYINFCQDLNENKHLWEDIYGEEDETNDELEKYQNIPESSIYDFSDIISLEFIDGDQYDHSLYI